jgi:heptosyltransferase-1
LSQVPAKTIPADYRSIVLLNPTRYLGNMLIAGGLIQDFYTYCQQRNIRFLLVIDESYRELLQGFLPQQSLLYYPRQRIKRGNLWQQASAYLSCLTAIRRFKADIAFNIEEDSVSHRLTQLSGARFKLGSNRQRNRHGYDHVLDINYLQRPLSRRHRWYGYEDVSIPLGLKNANVAYLRLALPEPDKAFAEKLQKLGLLLNQPFVIIHTSAAKDYKKWPASYFAELIRLLNEQQFACVLIGAGEADRLANQNVIQALSEITPEIPVADLCNQLSLLELALLMTQARAMVGNDSGPFHLGSALGLPGCVNFGPTEVALWRPLAENSVVLKADEECAVACTKTGCIYENRCLRAITPQAVLERLLPLMHVS